MNSIKGLAEASKASREAQNGYVTCRLCKNKFTYPEALTLNYGNGLLYSVCIPCVSKGNMVIIARTSKGIEVKAVPQSPIDIRSY